MKVIRSLSDFVERSPDSAFGSATSRSASEIVKLASEAIRAANELLLQDPRSQQPQSAESDPLGASALTWLNALLFQILLAQNLDTSQLPHKHRNTKIPIPDRSCCAYRIVQQWDEILKINWWPIFHVARETLASMPDSCAKNALSVLLPAATEIAEMEVIRHRAVAGRIIHGLLETRNAPATNYTTVPAAVMLAGLALDPRHPCWREIDWSSPGDLERLRIVDPACGTGTLLMETIQEILKRHRRSAGSDGSARTAIRPLLEHAIHGYDVVPTAVHLTATMLSMVEPSQATTNLQLFTMPYGLHRGRPRLGTLDFLQSSPSGGNPQHPPWTVSGEHNTKLPGDAGKRKVGTYLPDDAHLFIANPPYSMASRSEKHAHTTWSPMFGAVLSTSDIAIMTDALTRTLEGSPASLSAGLGSAFVVLAMEKLRIGGRLAFVLPATVLTDIRWAPVRKVLLEEFNVDWVVVSHDVRSQDPHGGVPGRPFVPFSKSTREGEALIVATRKSPKPDEDRNQFVRFVNLRHNPYDAIDAMDVTRTLLDMPLPTNGNRHIELDSDGDSWGEVFIVDQASLGSTAWTESTFVQGRLSRIASSLSGNGSWCTGLPNSRIAITTLADVCDFGPHHTQIKSSNQGLFIVEATTDQTRAGHPALWHHESRHITTIDAQANARLIERSDRDPGAQSRMLDRAGYLQIACELRQDHCVAAVLADEPMIGIGSWITLHAKKPDRGKEAALCLWLNSSLGLLLRLVHANRPRLGRSQLPHRVARSLPVFDIDALSATQREAAHTLFRELKQRPLFGFAHLAMDAARRELDHRFFKEVLGYSANEEIDKLAKMLHREPTIRVRY